MRDSEVPVEKCAHFATSLNNVNVSASEESVMCLLPHFILSTEFSVYVKTKRSDRTLCHKCIRHSADILQARQANELLGDIIHFQHRKSQRWQN